MDGLHDLSGFHVRAAVPEDRPAIAACARVSFEKYTPRIGKAPAPVHADYAAHIERDAVFVGELAGRFAGYMVLLRHGDAMLLDAIALLPEFQGKGLGGALMAYAEDFVLARGMSEIVLYTNVFMTENQTFYPAVGYEEYARKVEDGYDRIYYRKRLRPA